MRIFVDDCASGRDSQLSYGVVEEKLSWNKN